MIVWSITRYAIRLLIVGSCGAIAWLGLSEHGNRFLIEKLAPYFEIEVQGVSGVVSDRLCVERLNYALAAERRVKIEGLCFKLNVYMSAAFGYPRLGFLEAQSILLVFTGQPKSDATLLPPVVLPSIPLQVYIAQTNIHALQINDTSVRNLRLRQLQLSPARVNVKSLVFATEDFSYRGQINTNLTTSNIASQGTIMATEMSATYQLNGTLADLYAELDLPFGQLRGQVNTTLPNWPFNAQVEIPEMHLMDVGLDQRASANAVFIGDAQQFSYSAKTLTENRTVLTSGRKSENLLTSVTTFDQLPLKTDAGIFMLSGIAEITSDLRFESIRAAIRGLQNPFTSAAVDGDMALTIGENRIAISQLSITDGTGTLEATGHFDPADQRWEIALNTREFLLQYQRSRSRLNGQLQATNSSVISTLNLTDTAFDEFSIAEISLDMNTERANWAAISLHKLARDQQVLGDIALSLTGDLTAGEFELSTASERFDASATGQFKQQADGIDIDLMSLNAKTHPEWGHPDIAVSLHQPASIRIAEKRLAGEIVVDNETGGQATIALDTASGSGRLNLQDWAVPPTLAPGFDYKLETTLNGDLRTSNITRFALDGNLSASAIRMSGLPDDLLDEEIAAGVLRLAAGTDHSGTVVSVDGNLPELLAIKGQLKLVPEESQYGGHINLTLTNPELFANRLQPWATDARGMVRADLSFESDGQSHKLNGDAQWLDGTIDLALLGVSLTDINVTANATDTDSIQIDARAKDTSSNPISITGSLTGLDGINTVAELDIRSDELLAMDRLDGKARVSSNIRYTFRGGSHFLSGNMKVTEARYLLKSLPESAILPSEDVVVLGREQRETRQRLNTDIVLEIAEDTLFEAFGLATSLSGKLNYLATPGKPDNLRGTLMTSGGTFGFYGQKLSITQGTLVFNGPVDDPLVDVRANRKIRTNRREYIVTVSVRGYASDLTTQISSAPALPEADALSVLLTGRLLSDTESQEQIDIAAAALNLGLSGSGLITDRIAAATGLDELIVSSSIDGIEVGAGRRISHNLYLRYTYGTFSRIGGILLDYQLTESFRLRANTGDKESLEFQYIFPEVRVTSEAPPDN